MRSVCKSVTNWVRDERGAVSIDWVVMTAAVVALAIGAYVSFKIDFSNSGSFILIQNGVPSLHTYGGNAISNLISKTQMMALAFGECIFNDGGTGNAQLGQQLCSLFN